VPLSDIGRYGTVVGGNTENMGKERAEGKKISKVDASLVSGGG
jgi:hypothetical protein